MKKSLKKILVVPLVILLLAVVIRIGVGEFSYVPSASMEPTLLEGDWLWINKISYGGRLPSRWADIPLVNIFTWIPCLQKADLKREWKYSRIPGFEQPEENVVVVFNSPENKQVLMVKRIGKKYSAGDTLMVNRDNYSVAESIIINENGQLEILDNSIYINGSKDSCYILSRNHYFMTGDNEAISRDSRFWGCITDEYIVGRIDRVVFSFEGAKIRKERLFNKIQ